MTGSFLVVAATFMLASAAPYAGTVPAPGQTEAAAEPEVADAKPVCRPVQTTGSRLAKRRVCKSREEWKVIDQQNENALRSAGGESRAN